MRVPCGRGRLGGGFLACKSEFECFDRELKQ